ncbi:hypothetical protein BDF19DRAFT_415658 [Syncephalis fuscata]|nr:hypothetical protein BDF19DRAFT_415658 [Syncephalis fuscata]
MVSFVCNYCQDTIKKPKLDQHFNRCPNASFSCVDCSTDFYGTEYRTHITCISEAEKYQGALYKGAKKGGQQNNNGKSKVEKKQEAATAQVPKTIIDELKATTISDKRKNDTSDERVSRNKEEEIRALIKKIMKKEKEMTLKSLQKKLLKKLDKSWAMDKEALDKQLNQMIKLALQGDQIIVTL